MKYDFDKIVRRRGTGAYKYDAVERIWGRDDLLPMWVADMDFETPDFIVKAIRDRIDHPVYGYSLDPADYFPSIIDWIEARHGWKVEREWITYIPGIVKGIGLVVNYFTKPGDKVIVQPPVYHPFRIVPQENGREIVWNPLVPRSDGLYEMDFDNLAKVCDEKCKLLILSNPHNPVGIVWSRETLQRLADFCYDRHILVISDEIHCDMALFGNRHIPFASVSDKAARISITFGAPTKTFNMAGIVSSYSIVPNEDLRKGFYKWLGANELNDPNMLAPIATVAAFRKGEDWRRQMLSYVEGNILFVEKFSKEHIPGIIPVRPEASFLIWLDCRALGLEHEALLDLFVDKAHLALNDGEMFGPGGAGFMRLNVAAPRSVIEKAMESLSGAVGRL